MSGAEPATGPDLPERVDLVRAALPDTDQARFDQDLDQALDWARSTRDLRPLGHVVEAGGGWCSLVSTAAGEPQPSCWTGRSRQGVEVRAM